MPSNKDRLYVALYVRGGAPKMPDKEDTYHWALVVGPKIEKNEGPGEERPGTRYHVKNSVFKADGQMEWVFEAKKTSMLPTSALLVRVLIAKVENKSRLESVLRNTPVKQGEVGWNCVAWVQEALQSLEADGKALGTGVTEWTKVKTTAMEYCERKKKDHRFDSGTSYDTSKVATYDLIEGKETTP